MRDVQKRHEAGQELVGEASLTEGRNTQEGRNEGMKEGRKAENMGNNKKIG